MSLKDEIEKLIHSEQSKLEARDQKTEDYHETQRRRFAPLKAILEEITSPIDPKHVELSIGADQASIRMGYFRKDHSWKIVPNFEVRFRAVTDDSLFEARDGFRLEETIYYDGYDDEIHEVTHTFATQAELVEYLITEIVKQTAHYRHLDSRSSQS